MKRLSVLATGVLIVCALASCGSDSKPESSSSDPTTTTTTTGSVDKEPVCAARSEFSDSVSALVDPSMITGGKSRIESAFDDVKSSLDTLADTAKETYKPEVNDVKSALDDLKTAIGDVGDGKLSDSLAKIGDAISEVGRSAGALADALKEDCP